MRQAAHELADGTCSPGWNHGGYPTLPRHLQMLVHADSQAAVLIALHRYTMELEVRVRGAFLHKGFVNHRDVRVRELAHDLLLLLRRTCPLLQLDHICGACVIACFPNRSKASVPQLRKLCKPTLTQKMLVLQAKSFWRVGVARTQ